MIEQLKIMLSAWYQERDALAIRMEIEGNSGNADKYYRISCEKERLIRCIKELEGIVYDHA
jgi:hypothetical protein